MKFKFSKILMGVSALIVAGIVSVVPFNKVQAEVITPSNAIATVRDNINNTVYVLPVSLTYSFSGVNPDTYDGYDAEIYINPDGRNAFYAGLLFTNQIDPSGTCSLEFRLGLDGTAYHGVVSLNRSYSNFVTGPNILFLSDYVDKPWVGEGEAFVKGINEKVNEIDMAFNGLNPDGTVNETKTVEYNYNYAINEKIIEKLAQAEGVTLLYTFEYEGYVFTSTITSEDAAKIFSKDIPWYGPCYIASNCPTVMVGVAE